jgi:Flp pilus assembly protein CpaB
MAAVGQSRQLVAPGPNLRTPLFIFGVALALVAFLVMFAFGFVFVGRQQAAGNVPVVVAKADIDARTAITPDMLTISSMPATAVPPNTFLRVAQLADMTAAVKIYKNQAISSNLVVSPGEIVPTTIDPFLPIPSGYDALSIPASELAGVAGFIQAGDYIRVIASINTGQFGDKRQRPVVLTVFTDLHVIKVGPQSPIKQQSGVATSFTVVMTHCDAEYMDWLLLNATLKYTLESKDDYNKTPATAACTSAPSGPIGPKQVDDRWHFTSAPA